MSRSVYSNMCWNVFIEDVNSQKIKTFNIFDHRSFKEEVVKIIKSYHFKCKCRDDMMKDISRQLMYYYWGKCEYEIVLTGWPNGDTDRKVDIYEQVMNNWDRFTDYMWTFHRYE